MKNLSSFFYSILAGVSISIGGTVFLSLDNKIVGSIFFSLGLFAVCTFGFNLFTGKVGYIFEQKPSYLLFLLQVWIGNLIGSLIVGYSLRLTRISGISEKAKALCDVKLGDSPLSIFILAIFCNILMFIAVDGFKTNQHEIGKYIGVFMCVIVFILCGFEHCVANMFYFCIAGVWNGHTILYLLIMTLGNACGGVLIPLARRLQTA